METIEQKIYNGARAKEILDNEQFILAFEEIEKELTEAWKSSPARDAEGREKLFLMIQLLNKLQTTFRTRLETGVLAEIELNRRRSIVDRLRETWQ